MTESVSWADLIEDAGDVTQFEPVPDDDYDLVIVDASFKPTKAGKKMWSTKSRIEGGPHNGRNIWDNLVVTPESSGALMYFFRKMAVLGLTKEFFQTQPSDQAIAENLKGKRYRATVETRTYQGTRSNSIKTYHSPTGPSGAPAPSSAGLPASVSAPPPPAPAPRAQQAPPPPAPAAPAAPAPVAAAPAAPAAPVVDQTPPAPPAPVPTAAQAPVEDTSASQAPASPPAPPF